MNKTGVQLGVFFVLAPDEERLLSAEARVSAVFRELLSLGSYRFDDRGIPLEAFYCYWDARSSYDSVAAAESEDWSARGRAQAALQGRREIGAQMLEIVVWGYQHGSEASEALVRELAQVIRAGLTHSRPRKRF